MVHFWRKILGVFEKENVDMLHATVNLATKREKVLSGPLNNGAPAGLQGRFSMRANTESIATANFGCPHNLQMLKTLKKERIKSQQTGRQNICMNFSQFQMILCI